MSDDSTVMRGHDVVGYYDDAYVYDRSKKWIGKFDNQGYIYGRNGKILGRCTGGLIRNEDGEPMATYSYGTVRQSGSYVGEYDGSSPGGPAAVFLLIIDD